MKTDTDTETGADPHTTTLIGPLAEAYEKFKAAAAALEGQQRLFQLAQERYRVALGRFSSLAAGTDSGG